MPSRPASASSTTFARALMMLAAAGCGAAMALQARINGQLGRELGDGVLTAVLSFGSGWCILSIALALQPGGRQGLRRVRQALRLGMPWWSVGGGVAGALLVLSQGLAAAGLGVALFTVAVVCGQTISGLWVDLRGIGAAVAQPVSATRLWGSGLALVAVSVAVSAQFNSTVPVWLLLLPFLSGLAIAWQQALNAQVRFVAGSVLAATFINFTVGLTVLLGVWLARLPVTGWPQSLPDPLWLYLGGPMGMVFIAVATLIVRQTGVLLYGLAAVAGQLLVSLILDLLLPLAARPVAMTTVVGTIGAFIAVGIAALPTRTAR